MAEPTVIHTYTTKDDFLLLNKTEVCKVNLGSVANLIQPTHVYTLNVVGINMVSVYYGCAWVHHSFGEFVI